MVIKSTKMNCIITRQNRRVYDSPAHIPRIESCNVFGSSKIITMIPTDSKYLNISEVAITPPNEFGGLLAMGL